MNEDIEFEIKRWKTGWKIANGFDYSQDKVNHSYVVVVEKDIFRYVGKNLGLSTDSECEVDAVVTYPVFVIEKDNGEIVNVYTENCIMIK